MDAMATERMRGNRGPCLSQANGCIARSMDILIFRLNPRHLAPSGSQGDDRDVVKRPGKPAVCVHFKRTARHNNKVIVIIITMRMIIIHAGSLTHTQGETRNIS